MIRNHSMAAVPGPTVGDVNFCFPCFVHIHGYCFLQFWCPTVFISPGPCILLKFSRHDTLSYDVLKKKVLHCTHKHTHTLTHTNIHIFVITVLWLHGKVQTMQTDLSNLTPQLMWACTFISQWCTFPSVSGPRLIKIPKDRLFQPPSGLWSDWSTDLVVSYSIVLRNRGQACYCVPTNSSLRSARNTDTGTPCFGWS